MPSSREPPGEKGAGRLASSTQERKGGGGRGRPARGRLPSTAWVCVCVCVFVCISAAIYAAVLAMAAAAAAGRSMDGWVNR